MSEKQWKRRRQEIRRSHVHGYTVCTNGLRPRHLRRAMKVDKKAAAKAHNEYWAWYNKKREE